MKSNLKEVQFELFFEEQVNNMAIRMLHGKFYSCLNLKKKTFIFCI